jgi:hypothetical protein
MAGREQKVKEKSFASVGDQTLAAEFAASHYTD